MSNQAENFASLCKGNSVSQIKKALTFLKPSVRTELHIKYKADTIEGLAVKLA